MTARRSRFWIVPALGAVAVAVPAAYVLFIVPMQQRDPNDAVHYGTPEMQRLRKAYGDRNLAELQSVMAGADFEAAKLAAARLTIFGFEGSRLMFEELGRSSPELQLAVQQHGFTGETYGYAATALESGSDAEKAGALMFIDFKHDPRFPRSGLFISAVDRYHILVALVPYIRSAKEEDVVHYGELARKYASADNRPLIDLLGDKSPTVRLIAVTALLYASNEEALVRVKSLRGDPDARVRAAAIESAKSIQSSVDWNKMYEADQKAKGLDPESQAKKKAEKTLGMP